MYKKISDYGIIGNLYTVALVGLDGSIDWLCLPHIDSPSVFAALLDNGRGGRFRIAPDGEWDSTAHYMPGTNILVTRFRTRTGQMSVTDFMPVPEDGEEEGWFLYRLLEGDRGTVDVTVEFSPKFDYARAEPAFEKVSAGCYTASGAGYGIRLDCTGGIEADKAGNRITSRLRISGGSSVWFRLGYGEGQVPVMDSSMCHGMLERTAEFWKGWLRKSETGRTLDLGRYGDMVERSALVLKLLYFRPTGAIAAAATTSLPEEIGGVRNWDYRYTWVRDTSFTLQALFNLGHLSETEGYLGWVNRLMSGNDAGRLRIMYGIRGDECLPEVELDHLEGYKGSRPVRVGNAAAGQRQMDIYGELMDAALKLSDYVGKIDSGTWPMLKSICDHVTGHWREKDSGIWEVRGGPYHFVYSKVMCWVALDRGLTIAHRYGFPSDTGKWERVRDEIREEVLEKGFDERRQAFVQHYETGTLDASNLLLPVLGFLPYNDPRVISNLEATERELGHEGFLNRYAIEGENGDGIEGGEGTFLICTFWLVDNLIALGRLDEAETLLDRLEGVANHLGLFSEEYDVSFNEALGNFPQAFTHIGYINSVTALRRAREAGAAEHAGHTGTVRSGSVVLNDGDSSLHLPPSELAASLKNSMNILRGAFFDTRLGRVAYERMKRSEAYRDYVKLSYALGHMDPGELRDRMERIAFWINLYNVIVIHGVIETDVRDSVKEVRNFFRRVQYRIGRMRFSPDDIEHGVLRGNRRPPGSLLRRFGDGDERLGLRVDPIEPRIHFALVCASSSCPPIGVYTEEGLDRELDVAAGTFLNSGGMAVDRDRGRVRLSRVFKWYGGDFGGSKAERLRALARHLYSEEDRKFVDENARGLRVSYLDYDWRLNRY
jgi:GH15 family glucan-1,4-alpha-glucosidase